MKAGKFSISSHIKVCLEWLTGISLKTNSHNGTEMEKKDFAALESMCQQRFNETGPCFHVCSQENHPLLFHNDEEFKAAMNIVAFVAFLFPDICIYTFEIMGNHFHFTLSGSKERLRLFIKALISKLAAHPFLFSASSDINALSFKRHPINNLSNLRNVISYVNRNGAVVDPDENVFTYRWGANRFFFNREAKLRYYECSRNATCREKRALFHSAQLDSNDRVKILDGYVSPLCYCHVKEAESFFRNGRHYFYHTSRNIESMKDIAKDIGESLFYSDEDLFQHIRAACSKKYGCNSVAGLCPEMKIELAKELHFNFNAGNKQISRLLKMDIGVVNTLFPR